DNRAPQLTKVGSPMSRLTPHTAVLLALLFLPSAVSAWMLLSVYEAVQVFVFPRNGFSGSETGFSREDICPPDDPALAIFRTADGPASSDPLESRELEGFLEEEGFDGEERAELLRARESGAL
ncbi:MAG: hypothetical protein AAF637_08620, partial [Pseudomonadota bacterium]